MNLLSHEFTENGEISKAKVYADDAFYISKVIGFKEGLGTYFNLLGNIYGLQGNLKSSLESYFNSLQIRKILGIKEELLVSSTILELCIIGKAITQKL